MTFNNQKQTFLAKLDKSKKGSIDKHALDIINAINSLDNYYTTSSCSGRVYLYTKNQVKNQTQWLKVSHELINDDFFQIVEPCWLRYEGFIIHIACKTIEDANALLIKAQTLYKKSSIISLKKNIVEIRDSEIIDMPYYDNKLIYIGSILTNLINDKLTNNWNKIEKLKLILNK
jgi:tRNA wybutosine-synthesizing protein 3